MGCDMQRQTRADERRGSGGGAVGASPFAIQGHAGHAPLARTRPAPQHALSYNPLENRMLRLIIPVLLLAGCALPEDRSWLPMPVSQAQMMQCSLRGDMGAMAERNILIQGITSNQFASRCIQAAALENLDDLGRLISVRLETGNQLDDRGRALMLGFAEGCGIDPVLVQRMQVVVMPGDAPSVARGRELAPRASAGACAAARRIVVEGAHRRGLWP